MHSRKAYQHSEIEDSQSVLARSVMRNPELMLYNLRLITYNPRLITYNVGLFWHS